MIKIVLVDDEQPAREELRFLLEKNSEMEIIGEFSSGVQTIEGIPNLQPEVIFMDVHLQDMDGIDVVRALQQLDMRASVVFATAYDVHAIRAFELNAVDYILKPFSQERLKVTIDRIQQRIQSHDQELTQKISRLIQEIGVKQRPRKLAATSKGRVVLIDPQELLYVVAEGRYASLVTEHKMWPTTFSLHEIEERLDPAQFLQTHRAYIVNLDRIKEVIPWFNSTYKIIIDGEKATEIPVSRTYIKKLKERLDV
ncbi:LytR/AlgR family response regulator transcription factor [Desulfosporosinus meridiei]|uniref:Stage 0 sporulation protein A homolog n=1 Tax=Desulfosporosinus meridiei (strain ATCC BAA-275 / DSM 13257 / KCTC 12902 / NCIMB 13706 / S10) TaxID=768704 RepID=J7INC4_DESMD|nr:LytTR family DNA-binding domain-containing protein [Desulfosporosinus meridiei]AFQ43110.1 response regulator of the LytR/AlgR family [Desulfosporosinus meridiei DSM 13257]